MFQIALFLNLIYGAIGTPIHFQDCGSVGSYMVDEVVLNLPCKSQPCWLPLKKRTDATVSFISTDITASNITTKVYMMLANNKKIIDVTPISCPNNVCPILQQEKKMYSIQIKPNFHVQPIRVELYWETYNQKHEELFCVMFPLIIYDPRTHTPGGYYFTH